MAGFWDSENIFFNGDAYFESLIRDIEEAKEYITVEMYIFNDDILGRKVAAHLIKAHQRGVKVEIIVDGIGSYSFFDKLNEVFRKRGIFVKMYNPLPFYHPYYGKLSLLKKLQILGGRIIRMNRRNHRKIVTIDQNIMYAGSFNIAAEHTRYHNLKAWKDMGVRVTGEHVQYAVLNFKKVWKLREFFRYKKQLKKNVKRNWKQSPLRLNQTLLKKTWYFNNFISRIRQSQHRIWFMTPYFIPKRRLIRSLGNAAKRGVDVRLIISSETDVRFFRWLQFFYYAYLLKKGVKVYQYTETILHAKNYIIDDYMSIGSTNLNHRSLLHDLEVDLVITEEDNKRRIEENFLASIESQETITLEWIKGRPFQERVLSRLFFLFKYWF